MNKSEQAYIDSEILDIDEDNPYIIFEAGHKSRDEEIKELKNESLYWKKEYLELERKLVEAEVLKDGE